MSKGAGNFRFQSSMAALASSNMDFVDVRSILVFPYLSARVSTAIVAMNTLHRVQRGATYKALATGSTMLAKVERCSHSRPIWSGVPSASVAKAFVFSKAFLQCPLHVDCWKEPLGFCAVISEALKVNGRPKLKLARLRDEDQKTSGIGDDGTH